MNKLNITPEQRAKYTILAKLAREQKKLACINIRTEYADTDHWRTLASKYSVRMPIAYYPATELKYVKQASKKAGVDIKDYVESTGCKTLKEFAELNKNWSALSMVGLFLEYADQIASNSG